jgi:hypothetical protein
MGAGIVLMTLFRYHRPQVDLAAVRAAAADSLPPAVGTALVCPWVPVGPAHMQAALLDLARRGVLHLRDSGESTAKHKRSIVVELPTVSGLRPHEQAIADALWPHLKQGVVDLKAARTHLIRALPKFRRGVMAELDEAGMLDRDRRSARRGLRNSGVVVIVLAMAGFALFAALFGHLGDIPLLVPAAVLMTGFLFVIFGHTMSILSSRGAETAAAWRARQRELKRVARERLEPKELERWLPAAAGFGLAGPMLKAAKASGPAGAVPNAWLSELSDPSAALVVIMAATSSGAHAGGAGGGGAAGGGSSSAR